MADISKEQAYGLAYKAGAFHLNDSFVMDETVLLAFAQAAFKLGRNAGLEAAKDKVRIHTLGQPLALAEKLTSAIESLKDNTP